MRRTPIVFLLGLLVIISGCSGGSDAPLPIVGSWSLTKAAVPGFPTLSCATNGAQAPTGVCSAPPTITFASNGTLTIQQGASSTSPAAPVTGTWSLSGTTLMTALSSPSTGTTSNSLTLAALQQILSSVSQSPNSTSLINTYLQQLVGGSIPTGNLTSAQTAALLAALQLYLASPQSVSAKNPVLTSDTGTSVISGSTLTITVNSTTPQVNLLHGTVLTLQRL